MTADRMYLTNSDEANLLLASDPNALLLGMVLDQQVPMEKAFAGPAVIAERMGGTLDVAAIAAADPEEFAALSSRPPAIHRFPASMAERIQGVCRVLRAEYDGSAANIWATGTASEVLDRLKALPGFGPQKAAIFLALLGKQYGATPQGWRKAAGDYGRAGTFVSVADVRDPDSLAKVREAKRAAKQAGKQAATQAGTQAGTQTS